MYSCDTCSASYSYRSDCNYHMGYYNHWAVFECETCGRTFRCQRASEQHMGSIALSPKSSKGH